jgi:SAM-dependent methyltransferase
MAGYKDYDGYRHWKGWISEDFGLLSKDNAAYFRSETQRTGLTISSPIRILELGFGNGQFARWAITQGHEYIGAEIIQDLVQLAVASGISAIDARDIEAKIRPSSVDLVVAFDVFEHMELGALLNQLRLCRELLKPGGCVLARVPSGDSPFGRATQYGDITHRIVLGSSAIRQIADASGFTVRYIGAPAIPMWGVGVVAAVRRLAVRLLQEIFTKIIRVGFHSNADTVVNASMVFVLTRPSDATSFR